MQHAARLPLAAPAAASPSGRGRPPRCSAAVPAQGGTQRRVAGAGGRAASLVAHAGGGEEPNPVFGFLKAVQGGLPVIGLLSRLTTPENGFDGNKLSYSEYCRAQYDRAGNDFGTAATELARNRGSSTRAVLFVCWMVAQGAGVVADDQIVAAATRLSAKSVDVEYEAYRFEEALDAAAKRRLRLKTPPPLPSRADASALLEKGVRACCRIPAGQELAGDDAAYMQALRDSW